MDTIEEKVADAILQNPKNVKIGDVTYHVARFTNATLIQVSKEISRLPHEKLDPNNIFNEVMGKAKDYAPILADICATLILGYKNLTSTKIIEEKRLFGLIRKEKTTSVNNLAILSRKIVDEMTPMETNIMVNHLIEQNKSELAFFFGTLTSLSEINLLRPTKKTTQYGQ